AHKALVAAGEQARPFLQRTLDDGTSLERRRRVELLLEALSGPEGRGRSAARLRVVRAVEVLERIATPEAVALLDALGDGAPEMLLTQEAQAALRRLR